MSGRLKITRRDFINGVALGVAAGLSAGLSLSPRDLLAMGSAKGAPYPAALTGMRGSHPGSFEVAHALSRHGATWPRPDGLTDRIYDLVIVGRAIYFSREAYGADSVHPNVTWFFGGTEPNRDIPGTVSRFPLSDASRADLTRLLTGDVDYLEGMGRHEKIEALRALSYTDFLERRAGVAGEVATLLRDTTNGF